MNRIARTAKITLVCLAFTAAASHGEDAVRSILQRLQTDGLWGEITLEAGGVRQIRVEALEADTVTVREVIGPLQARPAVYELAAIRSAREIGIHRIPRRIAPYRPQKSARMALAIELVLPGFGYFYAGETRQGYALLGVASLAGATALATGENGAAGWIPFVTWTKLASMLHLRDEIKAANAAHRERAEGLAGTGYRIPLAAINLHF